MALSLGRSSSAVGLFPTALRSRLHTRTSRGSQHCRMTMSCTASLAIQVRYVFMHSVACVCLFVCVFACANVCERVRTCACACAVCARVCAHLFARTRAYASAYVRVCMRTCFACARAYVRVICLQVGGPSKRHILITSCYCLLSEGAPLEAHWSRRSVLSSDRLLLQEVAKDIAPTLPRSGHTAAALPAWHTHDVIVLGG